ncbi:MAG TPA: DUF4382 domain-containing protein [Ramlibacter sp.]|uniref:DUF4382 domain-containing protein n=1 Tax=Ramlibacter sp. TaxID=1917967 RepID=UPI002D5E49A6|nr:DUF4382 domain-containing protein [Ramlibacter sp.]HZY17706.1 DUF4382 domain-containing protein [Ramlibacter sp.]
MTRDVIGTGWPRWQAIAATALVAGLAACGGGGGGNPTSLGSSGTLRLALTDAPSCGYDNVFITVERVRVNQNAAAGDNDGGWRDIVLDTPRRIDLLNLTNGVLEELGQTTLPTGQYNQIRLVLAENTASQPRANAVKPTTGVEVPLNTPSGQSSGLKLQARFDVQSGQTADLVLDFDACRSVVPAGSSGNYNLKPVVRVMERVSSGIAGFVGTALAAQAAPATTLVTAQQGGVVVRSTVPDTSGRFNLAFLPAGSYDVVVTSTNFGTAVVTGVPVTTSTTTLNATSSAITPAASTMATVSGTATASGTPVADATVRVTQTLASGTAVEIVSLPVNAATGGYSLALPQGGPIRASYVAGGALAFGAPETAAAGQYRVEATAPGRTTASSTANVAGTASQTLNLTFAP